MNNTTTPTTPTTAPNPVQRMTYEQAEILATLVHSLRPEWGAKGIINALEKKVQETDATTLTLALLHASADPTNRTPAIIGFDGKHWDRARGIAAPPKTTEPRRAAGIDTSPMCPNHPELHNWECKPCNKPTPPPPNFRQMIADAAAAFSQSVAEALDPDHTTQDDLALAAPAGE